MAETSGVPQGWKKILPQHWRRQKPTEAKVTHGETPAEKKRPVTLPELGPIKGEDVPFPNFEFPTFEEGREAALASVRSELTYVQDEGRSSVHQEVPEITPAVLPQQCGFASDEVARELFERYLAEGLRRGGEINARYMTDDMTTILEQRMVAEGWQEVSQALNRGEVNFGRFLAYADVTALTLKLIAKRYPDFMLFGGGYGSVIVFYPGKLEPALDAALPANNPYQKKDEHVLQITMIRASDLARLYNEGVIDIKPERGTATVADSVVISARELSQKPALMETMQLFTPPSTPQARQALLHTFQAKSIQTATT